MMEHWYIRHHLCLSKLNNILEEAFEDVRMKNILNIKTDKWKFTTKGLTAIQRI